MGIARNMRRGSIMAGGAVRPASVSVPLVLAIKAAQELEGAVVVPPRWYGASFHERHKPMCASLIRVIRDVLESVQFGVLKKVYVLNECDGNIPCFEAAARDAGIVHTDLRVAVLDAWWYTIGELLHPGIFEDWNGLGHDEEGEISITMAMVPQQADMS